MKNLVLFLSLLLSLLLINACSESATEPTPTEPTYQLFPNGYFSTGFREEYTLTGSSSNGETHSGNLFILAQASETFNGVAVASILTQSSWTDVSTGAMHSSAGEDKWTLDNNDRRRLAVENPLSGQIFLATTPQTIPTTAKIGESGSFGTYTDQNGNSEVLTWRLESAGNNQAKFTIASRVSDSSGAAFSENDSSFIVGEDGTRSSMTIRFLLVPLGITTNWTGTRL